MAQVTPTTTTGSVTPEFIIEEAIFMARVAEQTERFHDMFDFLKPVIDEQAANISIDERNLISTAFKNLVAQRRVAWRTIKAIESNEKYAKY